MSDYEHREGARDPERDNLAAGLRELADWIDAHPDLTLPSIDASVYPPDVFQPPAAWAKALGGTVMKEHQDSLFRLVRSFGPIRLKVVYWRHTVCHRVVTGTEQVVIPARPASVEEREIVEWVCDDPILASGNPSRKVA